jgi:putative DNA primase/helicase
MNFAELVMLGGTVEDYKNVDSEILLRKQVEAREGLKLVRVALEHQLSLLGKEYDAKGPSEAAEQIADGVLDIYADYQLLGRRMAAMESEIGHRIWRTNGQSKLDFIPIDGRDFPRRDKRVIPYTDLGNAEWFAQSCGNDVRFNHKTGDWIIWNKDRQYWQVDGTESIFRKIAETIRQREIDAKSSGDKDLIKKAFGFEKRSSLEAICRLAKTMPEIADRGEGWDADPWFFGVANGIVDLKSGTFRAAQRTDLLTKCSPVSYVQGADCPRFKQFLKEVFGNEDVIRYVQKCVGYTMTGLISEHCFFACWGNGRNGKSTLLEVLMHIFGDYGMDLRAVVLEEKKFDQLGQGADLPGKRFVKCVETQEGKKMDTQRIKNWTGGEAITVRPLYKPEFTFQPTHKIWMAFNDKPRIDDPSVGMWSRVKLIPFENCFIGREDRNLLEKLRAESPGILNWAIEGTRMWQEERLEMAEKIRQATEEYEEESNVAIQFVKAGCVMDANASIKNADLYEAYRKWANANAKAFLAENWFGRKMKAVRGLEPYRDGDERGWRGIRVKE